MKPRGTEVYDEKGDLYALTTVDLYPGDIIRYDTFEFVDKNFSPKVGSIMPEPIIRFIQRQPFTQRKCKE